MMKDERCYEEKEREEKKKEGGKKYLFCEQL